MRHLFGKDVSLAVLFLALVALILRRRVSYQAWIFNRIQTCE